MGACDWAYLVLMVVATPVIFFAAYLGARGR